MDKPQYAVRAEDVPPRITPSNDPEPFATRMAGRIKRPLGDFFGLRNFGANLTRRMPDAGPVCPCGSGSVHAACCGRFIDQGMLPATAEQLMRSRYTAFTRANEPYLLATWHETTRPRSLDFDPEESVKWLGLRIDKVGEGVPMMIAGWCASSPPGVSGAVGSNGCRNAAGSCASRGGGFTSTVMCARDRARGSQGHPAVPA